MSRGRGSESFRKGSVGRRRVDLMTTQRRHLMEQRRQLLRLQKKLKDGTAVVVDGVIHTVPYKEIPLPVKEEE